MIYEEKTLAVLNQAKVHEIFVSLQGEGPYAGEKQIFFRFSRCNMACAYCDTDNSAGQNRGIEDCAVDIERLFWREGSVHSLSITGGEPLLYPKMIPELSQTARRLGLKVFLETNSTLPKAFKEVRDLIDVVAMDLKLPGVGRTPSYWKEHQAFLELSRGWDRYVKMVLSEETCFGEFHQAIDLIAQSDPQTPLILQPVVPLGGTREIAFEKSQRFKEEALSKLWDVRIQPQWHKMWKMR